MHHPHLEIILGAGDAMKIFSLLGAGDDVIRT
jgi:hypothetical protein